ncbi:hypothetical protein ACE6H2_015116 [Prunus campanulata]
MEASVSSFKQLATPSTSNNTLSGRSLNISKHASFTRKPCNQNQQLAMKKPSTKAWRVAAIHDVPVAADPTPVGCHHLANCCWSHSVSLDIRTVDTCGEVYEPKSELTNNKAISISISQGIRHALQDNQNPKYYPKHYKHFKQLNSTVKEILASAQKND